jgi:CBS domain containing-hemolysin-like protein
MFLLILYLLLAIGVSFLCSILEAIILSVTPSYIAYLERERPGVGSKLRRLKSNVDKPLSAILSLNTIAHTVGAAGVGAQSQVVFGEAYVTATSFVLTFLILVLSEIIPKTLGATYWRGLAPPSTAVVQVLIYVLYPFVGMSLGLTKLLGGTGSGSLVNRAEFGALAELGVEEGVFDESLSRIVKNLIRFSSLRGRDIMTPRTVVVAFNERDRIQDVLSGDTELPVSRVPVYKENIDQVSGYVFRHDLMQRLNLGKGKERLLSCRREVLVLPELIKLDDLFQRFLEKQEHIAVLVDEYGGLSGIVTMEDLVETLIGSEIVDEVDSIRDMQALARERWRARARRLGLISDQEWNEPESDADNEAARKEAARKAPQSDRTPTGGPVEREGS